MRTVVVLAAGLAVVLAAVAAPVTAAGFEPESVFSVKVMSDHEPAVAGESLRLAVEVRVDSGWHVNSDDPGDEFSVPTSVTFKLPEGWPEPTVSFPPGEQIEFDFSETPLEVWEGRVTLLAELVVPAEAEGDVRLVAEVTAQACNNTQCLPPLPVRGGVTVNVVPTGGAGTEANADVFRRAEAKMVVEHTAETAPGPGTEQGSSSTVLGWALLGIGFTGLLLRFGQANPVLDRVMRAVFLAGAGIGAVLIVGIGHGGGVHLEWQAFDQAAVDAAIASGQPVIVDFAADWCAPCRELDERTFSDPLVAAKLEQHARFKADLTAANAENDQIRRAYKVAGVPTVMVFNGGEESFRITGFEPPERFLKRFGEQAAGGPDVESRLSSAVLPLQILLVFLAGLALNLTPCVYPLIPITVGFFSQQAKERSGGTFGIAVAYVLGISVTYSVVGVVAALTGQLFGSALQNPIVIGVVVAVLLALSLSMFGIWELKVPMWAGRVSGGRGGYLGSLLMGLMVGFVAAPCIGPFVLGLLTYVGQKGSPVLGFVLFFSLSMGLGLPYLLLGTFAGAVNRLPASGAWMIGVRKVFGVLLVALAVYFAEPLLTATVAAWAMGLSLVLGGGYLLLVERTGHANPTIDRVMRLVTAATVIAGVVKII